MKFQAEISKHMDNKTKFNMNQETHYIRVCTTFEGCISFMRPRNRQNEFDLLLVVKKVKVARLRWNSKSMCRANYRMYVSKFKLISIQCSHWYLMTLRWRRGPCKSNHWKSVLSTDGQNGPNKTKGYCSQETHYICVYTKFEGFNPVQKPLMQKMKFTYFLLQSRLNVLIATNWNSTCCSIYGM